MVETAGTMQAEAMRLLCEQSRAIARKIANWEHDEVPPIWLTVAYSEIKRAILLLDGSLSNKPIKTAEPAAELLASVGTLEAIKQGPTDLELLVRIWEGIHGDGEIDSEESAECAAVVFDILKKQADSDGKLAKLENRTAAELASAEAMHRNNCPDVFDVMVSESGDVTLVDEGQPRLHCSEAQIKAILQPIEVYFEGSPHSFDSSGIRESYDAISRAYWNGHAIDSAKDVPVFGSDVPRKPMSAGKASVDQINSQLQEAANDDAVKP